MYRPGLLTSYISLLAGAATANFSAAVITRSASTSPHYGIVETEAAFLQAASTTIEATDATTACLPTMNMLRVLNLRDQALEALEPEPEGVGEEEDGEAETKSKTALEIAKALAGTDADTCDAGATANAQEHTGLVIPFEYSTAFDCGALIQGHFAAGLSHIQESNFGPATGKYDIQKAPFNNLSASNVANIIANYTARQAFHELDNNPGAQLRRDRRHNLALRNLYWPMMNAVDCRTELYEALLQRQVGSSSIALTSVATTLFCTAWLLLS